MSAEPHILVVDDDARLRELLRRYLTENGFTVTTAHDAASARARLASLTFDLLVIDIMMPGEDGLSLTRGLRADSAVPILLLTARGGPDDRIEGLEQGADDYMPKPFQPRELVLRINAILRRAPPEPAPLRAVSFGPWQFDPACDRLERAGEPVALTTAEARLLRALARSPGRPVSREDLAESEGKGNEGREGEGREREVGAPGAGGAPRAVDVQVGRLRRKIETDPRDPRYLQTVRGQGYVLQTD